MSEVPYNMPHFDDLTESEIRFREMLCNRYRWRLFVRECLEAREASGQSKEGRKNYAALAAKNGWL